MTFCRSLILVFVLTALAACASSLPRPGYAQPEDIRPATTESGEGVKEVLRAVHFHIRNDYVTQQDMRELSQKALQFFAKNYAENLILKPSEKAVDVSCREKKSYTIWMEDEVESLLSLKYAIEPCMTKPALNEFRFYEYALAYSLLASLPLRGEFFTREKTEELYRQMRGNSFGIGLEIGYEKEDCIIINTIAGGPAAVAEIPKKAILRKIDGVSVAGLGLVAIVQKLRGADGSTVTLEIQTAARDARSLKTYTLKRQRIQVAPVETSVIQDKILYIKIKTLSVQSADLVKAAASGASKSIQGIVIDLRGSTGGLADGIRGVTSPFLREEFIFEARGRKPELNKKFTTGPEVFLEGKRMIVLTDEYTAAGSEMVAIALQQNGRARIFGARTQGKGDVSNVISLMYGNSMQMPIQEMYRPDGRSMREFPVKPDVEIPAGEDSLKAAVKALSE